MSLALLLAAAAAGALPICTDRPARGNAVCTVPAGRLQLESSLIDWTRAEAGGVTAKTLLAGSSVLKLGLSDRSDLQFGFTPYVRVESGGRARSGVGDVMVRYKHRLTAADAPVQAALIPFVKLPTARRGIGNGKTEGGLAAPISIALAGPVTATVGPELDVLADGDGHGRHLGLVNLVNLSAAVAPRLTLAGELWSNLNFDPGGTLQQASADAAAAYAVSEAIQIDGGLNLGLTRDTPDIELYAGFSKRF